MVAALVLGGLVGWGGLAAGLDAWAPRSAPSGRWDAVIVPGAAVWPGGVPSGALERRVRAAVALWRGGGVERIVLTGGLGRHPPTEAEVAADLCRRLGVPDDALVLEAVSTDTLGNASGAAALVGPARVVVVTDTYHAFRCARMFARHFPQVAVVGTVPPPRARARMALREVASVLWHGATGGL